MKEWEEKKDKNKHVIWFCHINFNARYQQSKKCLPLLCFYISTFVTAYMRWKWKYGQQGGTKTGVYVCIKQTTKYKTKTDVYI